MYAGTRDYLSSASASIDVAVTDQVSGAVIFTGRLFRRPGETHIRPEFFDILANYVRQDDILQALINSLAEESTAAVGGFNRPFYFSGFETTKHYFADYSYGRLSPGGRVLSDPVPDHPTVHRSLPLVASCLYTGAAEVKVLNGSSVQERIACTASAPVNAVTCGAYVYGAEGDTLKLDFGASGSPVLSPEFRIVDDCSGPVLYYVNAFGGWDWLMLRNRSRVTETYDRQSVGLLTGTTGRARRDYRVAMGKRWELSTDWLNDAESLRFSVHVPGTPLAVLYDPTEARMLPVTIVDGSMETERSVMKGRSMVRYTISVELAADRVRM